MVKKNRTQKKNNEPTIDDDSPEIEEKMIKEGRYNSNVEMSRNNDFSINIFLYSYPIPLRCSISTFYPRKMTLEKEI